MQGLDIEQDPISYTLPLVRHWMIIGLIARKNKAKCSCQFIGLDTKLFALQNLRTTASNGANVNYHKTNNLFHNWNCGSTQYYQIYFKYKIVVTACQPFKVIIQFPCDIIVMYNLYVIHVFYYSNCIFFLFFFSKFKLYAKIKLYFHISLIS